MSTQNVIQKAIKKEDAKQQETHDIKKQTTTENDRERTEGRHIWKQNINKQRLKMQKMRKQQ